MVAYINEILFLIPIVAVAIYHAKRFAANKPTSNWFHFLWACFFGLIIAGMWLLMHKDWLFAGSLVVERFVFFNPVLNYFRKPRQAFFYVHSEKNGSWIDRILKKVYAPVWIVSAVGFIVLQFFL